MEIHPHRSAGPINFEQTTTRWTITEPLPARNKIGLSAPVVTVEAGNSADSTAAFAIADPMSGRYVFRYTERFGRGVVEVPFVSDGG